MSFYVEKVYIDGFALFSETYIEFDKGLNVIVGDNGSCKTILIELINSVLCNDINNICKYSNKNITAKKSTINIDVYVKFKNNIKINNIDNDANYLNKIYDIYCIKNKNINIDDKLNEITNISNIDLMNNDIFVKLSFIQEKKSNYIGNIDITICKNNDQTYDKCDLIINDKFEQNNNIEKYVTKFYYNCYPFVQFIKKYCKKTNPNDDKNIEYFYDVLKNYIKKNVLYLAVDKKFEKNKLTNIKLNGRDEIYDKIKQQFNNIISKNFTIKMEKICKGVRYPVEIDDNLCVNENDSMLCGSNKCKYECEFYYYIYDNGNIYECSYGETELINFLTSYYDNNDNCIMLCDEPCNHLSSQNKNKISNFVNKTNNNQQMFIVTHDVDLVDPIKQNFIHINCLQNNEQIHMHITYKNKL